MDTGMLTQVCQELKNWFVRSMEDIHNGWFIIRDGEIIGADFLLPGQYYRVEGSVFNDGVHKEGEADLHDEIFDGVISGMAVPPAVIDLVEEIGAWVDSYGKDVASPYQSESWGGYSYSKGGGGSGNAAGTGGFGQTWQGTFAARLNRWRKA